MDPSQPDLAGTELPQQTAAVPVSDPPDFPGWYDISFFGHAEETGLVTIVTLPGDRQGYRIEYADKVFGGDQTAWIEYDTTAYFSKRPVDPQAVYTEWAAKRERAEMARQQRAQWERENAEREARWQREEAERAALAARALPAGAEAGSDPEVSAADGVWAESDDDERMFPA